MITLWKVEKKKPKHGWKERQNNLVKNICESENICLRA